MTQVSFTCAVAQELLSHLELRGPLAGARAATLSAPKHFSSLPSTTEWILGLSTSIEMCSHLGDSHWMHLKPAHSRTLGARAPEGCTPCHQSDFERTPPRKPKNSESVRRQHGVSRNTSDISATIFACRNIVLLQSNSCEMTATACTSFDMNHIKAKQCVCR